MSVSVSAPRCKNLVLDAGPLLSLSPLRGLAEKYLTVPQVLAELKDKRAREHFERLGLTAGVQIEVIAPDAASLAAVIRWAKKTGDYAVLSHPDLCVLALTYSLHQREAAKLASEACTEHLRVNNDAPAAGPISEAIPEETNVEVTFNEDEPEDDEDEAEDADHEEGQDLEPLDVELQPLDEGAPPPNEPAPSTSAPASPEPIFDDPSDDDDGEGEWITPSNVGLYKSRALELLPGSGAGGKGKHKAEDEAVLGAGCMTADFAMQNVLLQMGLNLVGVEGKRIQKVKSWVLRCHACFKICKDNSKKFCPSCGNATLLRASVTISTPGAAADAPAMQVHLKSNFQYRLRGTKYSIPAPKPGSAKKGTGEGLILREDQTEYLRAKKMADGKREREEAKMNKGILGREVGAVGVGSWMDPDWMPEMLSVGAGGKGRTMRASGRDGDLPAIGYGRKNPNERKRRK
ncbi:Nin one binding Zn-ribbon like-domain-containing protein [Mycena rosella]|uniref:20S-pre-rRNA D-site endonuclease NOB1 n=1 Tax=Mycena rosella TaxID=1033263 RepID=A0AAD7BL92_MYCRO|nr:Nin one binding Zn-ribbon like-domain-containing protein [Mycena rosella]